MYDVCLWGLSGRSDTAPFDIRLAYLLMPIYGCLRHPRPSCPKKAASTPGMYKAVAGTGSIYLRRDTPHLPGIGLVSIST